MARTQATVAGDTFIVTVGTLGQASWSGAGDRIQRGPGRDPARTRCATSSRLWPAACGGLHCGPAPFGHYGV